MKTNALLLFLATASLLADQDKPKDPFVKGKPEPAPAKQAEPPQKPHNLLCLVETITLPQGDYASWLDAPEGRTRLYEQAQAAVKGGAAKLDGCHFLTLKSGQRVTLEGVDELMHPVEWQSADSTGFQYPTAYETQRLGDGLELECVLENGTSGAVSVTHAFSRDRFLGFRPCKADGTLPGVPVSDFYEQQGPASRTITPDAPVLLSTLTSAQPGQITLVFGTFKVVTLGTPAAPAAKGNGNTQMTARVVSLDRAKGADLLKKHAHDAPAALAVLKTMMEAKEAVLEHVSTLVTQPGTRTTHQSGAVVSCGTGFHPPEEGRASAGGAQKLPSVAPPVTAGVASLEKRQLGFRWEIECVVNPEGTLVDATLSFAHNRLNGPVKDKNWNEHYPEIGVFSSQQIVTALTQPVDSTILVGTLNPPGETGVNERQDEGRMWLLFLHTSLE